jgi:hypothetical protein
MPRQIRVSYPGATYHVMSHVVFGLANAFGEISRFGHDFLRIAATAFGFSRVLLPAVH